jgi:hypothetical protein
MFVEKTKILILWMLVSSFSVGFGQTKIFSPFSGLGFGQMAHTNFHFIRGASLSDAAYNESNRTNLVNPAALGFINTAMFDAAFDITNSTVDDGLSSANKWTGNINYMSLAFSIRNPINKATERIETDFHWGMGFNLKPFSQVGYDIESADSDEELGTIQRNYQGEGGTYIASWSNGWRYKETAIGVNFGVLFGKSAFERTVRFPNSVNYFRDIFLDEFHYGGIVWSVGAQQRVVLEREVKPDGSLGGPLKTLTFGLYGNSNWNVDSEADQIYYRQHSFLEWRDTLVSNEEQEYSTTLPAVFGIGVMYKIKDKLDVSVDFRRGFWTNYDDPLRPDAQAVEDSWRFSTGVCYTPDRYNISKFFKRVSYFGGFYYEKDPRILNGEQITDIGATAGFTLPFFSQQQLTLATVAFRAGRRGVVDDLTETYFNIAVGFTMTDNTWFLKRKYN